MVVLNLNGFGMVGGARRWTDGERWLFPLFIHECGLWLLRFPVSFFHWLVIFVLYQSEHLNHITCINVAWCCAISVHCTEA